MFLKPPPWIMLGVGLLCFCILSEFVESIRWFFNPAWTLLSVLICFYYISYCDWSEFPLSELWSIVFLWNGKEKLFDSQVIHHFVFHNLEQCKACFGISGYALALDMTAREIQASAKVMDDGVFFSLSWCILDKKFDRKLETVENYAEWMYKSYFLASLIEFDFTFNMFENVLK